MLRDMLNLINAVTISRETITNSGNGDTVTTTVTTTVGRAAIWQNDGRLIPIADKNSKVSSHVLAFEPSDYVTADTDATVSYAGNEYQITTRPDDVANRGKLLIVGMERVS